MKNKILFFTILILTMSFSCAYANYTEQDVYDQLTILKNAGLIQDIPQYNNGWNTAMVSFRQFISNYGLENYAIIIYASNSSIKANRYCIYCCSGGATKVINYTNDSTNTNYNYWKTNTGEYDGFFFTKAGQNNSSGAVQNNIATFQYVYTTIPIETRGLTLGANKEIGGNYLADALEFYPYNNEIVSTNVNAIKNIYRFSVVSLGQITNYLDDDRYNYVELLQNNNIVASMTYNNISKRITNSNNMDIESNDNEDIIRVNNWILYLDELYTLNIYSGGENISKQNYNEMQTYYYIFLRENAVINNGNIINYGSGEGYTTQNSTNDIINNQNNNNTFWENAYKNLFVVSGDYIEQKLTQIKEENNFSGDLQEELAFLNLISGDKGDFVISWNSFTPHFSLKGQQINNVQMISGDSINFSKLERENQSLHEAMEWARTLLCFSIGVLLIRNYWTTLLHTFGVGTQVYDSVTEEAKIAKQSKEAEQRRNEANIRNAYEKQRYREWLRGHRK